MHNKFHSHLIITLFIMKRFFTYFAAIAAGAMLALACEPENQPSGEPDNGDNGGNNGNTTVAVTSVILNETVLSLEVGDVATLTATVQPDNATNKAVTWNSNAPAVATVDAYGLVTAVGEGTAVITATAGECTAEVNVTVTVPEVILSSFSDVVENYEELSEGVYAVELPIEKGYSFAGEFDFKDLFEDLPEGTTFALAPIELQNAEAVEYYESLTGNLAADGVWTRNERFAHDLNVGDDNSVNGVRVLVSANGNTIFTINFYILDPVVGLEMAEQGGGHVYLKTDWLVEFAGMYGDYGSLEMELGDGPTYELLALKHGANNDLNLVALLNDITNFQSQGPYFSANDSNRILFSEWPYFSVSGTNGEELFFNDTKNGKIALTEYGQALCTSSKGVFFQQQWSVCVNCCNWQLAEADRPVPGLGNIAEGVGINGKVDFVGPAEAEVFTQEVGIYLTADGHIKTTENYKGQGARISAQMHFEYDYGSVCVSPRYFGMFFVNRRWAAPGEIADVVYPYTDGQN